MDDDESNRTVVAELLRDDGHAVTEAANGQEALERLAEKPPDAIILDLMMPIVDGFTFLIQRRKLPDCGNIPVLVLTGVHKPSELVGALGVRAVVSKPFEAGQLLDQLVPLLNG